MRAASAHAAAHAAAVLTERSADEEGRRSTALGSRCAVTAAGAHSDISRSGAAEQPSGSADEAERESIDCDSDSDAAGCAESEARGNS